LNRNDLLFLCFSVLIGLLAAVGALFFRTLIDLFQFLFWPSGGSFIDQIQAAPWWWKLLIPVSGAMVAGPLIAFFAPEAKGPGVPEVIVSVTSRHSTIRHRVTFLKAIITSLLLGCGASVGREGPIVQIGSSVGSSLAQAFKLKPELRRVCLACGAAAGIAATFNAPIAGSLFALEIILLNIEISYISHIVISSVTASVLSRMFWGEFRAFEVIPFVLDNYSELVIYLLLGVLAGFVAIAFVKLIFQLDSFFSKLPLPDWLKPALGGLALGLLAIKVPHVLGVGYETVNAALADQLVWQMALLLLFMKVLATAMCIGSGMSGGIFAPSLFLGATLGTVVGLGANAFFFELGVSPAHFALAGMGAVVSGTTLAPITAIVTIFELTLHYQIILPLMLSCISSCVIVRIFFGYSAYEMKLLKQGVNIFRGHDLGTLRNLLVGDFLLKDYPHLLESDSLQTIMEAVMHSTYPHFVVFSQQGKLVGVLSLRDLRNVLPDYEQGKDLFIAADLMTKKVITLKHHDNLEKAMRLFEEKSISFVPVVNSEDSNKVLGILTKDALLKAYDEKVLKDRILSLPAK
jgi:CIC family chloride channel protein